MDQRTPLEPTLAAALTAEPAERRVHCPGWLGARVYPQGTKGGYAFLIETESRQK